MKLSISKRISIIAGYEGTGKTTVLKAPVDVAEQQFSSVFILALAGKFKERAREAIGRDDTINLTKVHRQAETRVHRQAETSPIYKSAMVVREGKVTQSW